MKIKNINLRNNALVYKQELISFNEDGISGDVKKEVAEDLLRLPNFSLIEDDDKKAKTSIKEAESLKQEPSENKVEKEEKVEEKPTKDTKTTKKVSRGK